MDLVLSARDIFRVVVVTYEIVNKSTEDQRI